MRLLLVEAESNEGEQHMIRCQLRCQGERLDVEALVGQLPWEVSEVFHKGKPMFQTGSLVQHQVSGFAAEVAVNDDGVFFGLTDALEEFLCDEAELVARVATFPGVERLHLEVQVTGTTRFQSNYGFPPSLLRLLADLNLPLEVVVTHEDGLRELQLQEMREIPDLN